MKASAYFIASLLNKSSEKAFRFVIHVLIHSNIEFTDIVERFVCTQSKFCTLHILSLPIVYSDFNFKRKIAILNI